MTGTIETLRDTSIDPQSQRRSVVGAHSRAKKRRQLTKAQAEQAGRKAATIMKEEPQSLTAKGKEQKRKQSFAIAVHKLFGGK